MITNHTDAMRIKIVIVSAVIASAGIAGPVGLLSGPAAVALGSSQHPTVTGLHITKRTAHSISFDATVNPRGLATKAEIVATHHGRTVGGATRSAGAGSSPTTLHFTITHLHAARHFRVRVTATNSAGTAKSAAITATTAHLHR